MNILETEDIVKGLPDEKLFQEAQTPSGQLPQYLLVSEVQRRVDMRKRFANAEPQPEGTVYNRIMREAATQTPQDQPQQMVQQPQPQMPPQMQQMAAGGIVQLQAGGPTPYGSDHFQIVVNGQIHDIPMKGYSSQDDAIEAYALENGLAEINPENEGFDPTWGGTSGTKVDPMTQGHSPVQVTGTGANPEIKQLQSMLASETPDEGGITSLTGDNSQDENAYSRLLAMVGQPAEMPPDFDNLIAQQRQDALNGALIQLGAGIASGKWPEAMAKAGETAMEGKQAARQLEMQNRLLAHQAKEGAKERDIGILGTAAQIEQREADNAATLAASKIRAGQKTVKGDDGYLRYVDTGERVFPSLQKEAKESDSVREAKISDVMKTYNLARGDAAAVVDGIQKIEVNPNTGRLVKIDQAAGTAKELSVKPTENITPSSDKPSYTLYDLAGKATGLVPGTVASIAKSASVFGVNPEQEAVEAQQIFASETQNLIRALAVNPRFPTTEMERIRKEINIQPSMIKGAGTLQQTMKGLDKSLRQRLENAQADANDASLPDAVRQSQASNAAAIRNFLPILGVPQEKESESDIDEQLKQAYERLRQLEEKSNR